ncbi:MAG: metalloregulator ArsR/SmtB family transcription factor [Azoarcus sp.]|nr:metalloregulator ArsR/SmtB family transcription factor [Azoarcus sp.]
MDKAAVLQVFESLSSGIRLDVFRLLVQAGRSGRVAGEIASSLDIPSTNLSFHLKTLVQSGLLTVEQEGRFQRYRANIPLMLGTIAFLTENCCAGHPEDCAELRGAIPDVDAFLPPLECSKGDSCS